MGNRTRVEHLLQGLKALYHNTTSRRRVIVYLSAAFLLCLTLLLRMSLPGYTRINLTDDGTGRIILSAVIPESEPVILTWRNSQFGLLVKEVFFTRSGLLVQDQVTFSVPGGPPPPRVLRQNVDDLDHTGGAFDARGLSRPFNRIVYRIGEIGDPKLQVQNKTVSLKQAVGFGGRVILTAARPVLYEVIFHR